MRIQPALLALTLAASQAGFAAAPASAAPPAAAEKKAVDPLAKKITGSEAYVPVFGLRASITRGFKVQGFLAVDAGLDAPQPKTRKKIEVIKPRLISDMREAVANYTSLSYIAGEAPNADMLRTKLQRAVDQTLGQGEATVTLASVIIFPD